MSEMLDLEMNSRLLNCIDKDKLKKEKIDGKIYLMASPGRTHICVTDNLALIFNNYFKQNKRRCRAFTNAELYINEKNYLVPDIKVLCREKDDSDVPVIVAEILSKSTRKRDLGLKMQKYAELGIKEYWIVTLESLSVDIYLLGEDKRYELYNSYSIFVASDRIETFDEDELEQIVSGFCPVSFPELELPLEDIFDIFE